MKRLLCICIFLGYAFVLGQTESAQDSPPIAAVQFSGSGITDLETQVLFNRFLEELTKASDNSLMDQEISMKNNGIGNCNNRLYIG